MGAPEEWSVLGEHQSAYPALVKLHSVLGPKKSRRAEPRAANQRSEFHCPRPVLTLLLVHLEPAGRGRETSWWWRWRGRQRRGNGDSLNS